MLLALIFFYLLFSYVRFYHFIGDLNLKSPYNVNSLVVENPKGTGSVKYIALGDSLSAGVGSTDVKNTFVYSYAVKLSGKYEKVNVLNLSKPGGTTSDVINYQIPQAITEKPDFVTLLIGINDMHNKVTISDFRERYLYILNELLTKTNAKIMVMDLPYLGSDKIVYPPFNILLNFRTKQFNAVITKVVNGFSNTGRIQLVSLYKNTYLEAKQNPGYYAQDLFHPSDTGYALWGKIINDY